MLKKFAVRGVLTLAMLAFIVRLFYYAQMTNAWWVLLSEPLHGLTFAAMWAASVEYADQCAPPGLSATAQGLTSACFRGLGTGTGAIVGGYLFDLVGPQWLFRIMATTVTIAGILYWIATSLLQYYTEKNAQTYRELQAMEGETPADGVDPEESPLETTTVAE